MWNVLGGKLFNPEMHHQWRRHASSLCHWWQLGWDRMFFTHLQMELSSQKKKLLIKGQKNSMTTNYGLSTTHSLLPYHFPIRLSHPLWLCPIQSMYVPLVILHWQLIKKYFQTTMATDAKSSMPYSVTRSQQMIGHDKVLFLLHVTCWGNKIGHTGQGRVHVHQCQCASASVDVRVWMCTTECTPHTWVHGCVHRFLVTNHSLSQVP